MGLEAYAILTATESINWIVCVFWRHQSYFHNVASVLPKMHGLEAWRFVGGFTE